MTTWFDIKLATLQKMFAASEKDRIVVDESTKDYIYAMPYTANEGLQLLSTAGKFIIKPLQITHNPVKNQLSTQYSRLVQLEEGSYTIGADGSKSYYFQVSGKGTCEIFVGNYSVETINIDNKQGFAEYKGLLENPNKEKVELVFTTDYPMALKNMALYTATWETADEVQTYGEKVRYHLRDLTPDFYMLDTTDIYFEGNSNPYTQTQEYWQEGNTVLVLDREKIGNYTIYYKAYPTQITINTEDDYEMPIDEEVAVLLPLYMASQLYKDDDNGIATSYRNEFEVAFERLKNKANAPSAGEFISKSGWI